MPSLKENRASWLHWRTIVVGGAWRVVLMRSRWCRMRQGCQIKQMLLFWHRRQITQGQRGCCDRGTDLAHQQPAARVHDQQLLGPRERVCGAQRGTRGAMAACRLDLLFVLTAKLLCSHNLLSIGHEGSGEKGRRVGVCEPRASRPPSCSGEGQRASLLRWGLSGRGSWLLQFLSCLPTLASDLLRFKIGAAI